MNNITQSNTDFMLDTGKLESAYRLANAFHKAGCFNATVQNPEQALVVIMAGREAGLEPVEAMNSFYFVKGHLQMYGAGLAKVIARAGITIKLHKLDKEEIDVEYLRDTESIHRSHYTSADLPETSKAKSFAPEEKLVYHAHSRFLRYHDVGASVPYTDYDQEIIEANENRKTKEVKQLQVEVVDENAELKKFIENEANTLEALAPLAQVVKETDDVELLNLYTEKVQSLQPKKQANVTQAQLTHLHAMIGELASLSGTEAATIKSSLLAKHSLESSKDLTIEQYNQLTSEIELAIFEHKDNESLTLL